MTLVPSHAFVNWLPATFVYTPPGGTQTTATIGEIESCDPDFSGTPIEFEGDAAPGPTKQKLTKQKRHVKIVTADEGTVLTIPPGVEGTLTLTRLDSVNDAGVGGGGYTMVLINAMMMPAQITGKHADYGKTTITFQSRWTLTAGVYVDPRTVTPL